MSERSAVRSVSLWRSVLAGAALGAGGFVAGHYFGSHTGAHAASAAAAQPGGASAARTERTSANVAAARRDTPAASELDSWRSRIDHTAPSSARERERLKFIAAWARVAPHAALEYVRTNLLRDRQAEALTIVFENWAGADPAAAWDWVLTRENGDPGHLRTVIAEVARNDATLAEKFAAGYAAQHPDLAANAYMPALDGIMDAGNYAAAQRLIATAAVPNDEQRNMLLNYVAGEWARYQPDAAAQWVLAMAAGPVRTQALDAVGQAWSDVNPARAAEFAVSLPAGPERQTALRQAISKWTMDDPLRAGEWVLKYNAHGDFDQAVAAIATSPDMMNHNVPLALGWAGNIQQDNLRRQTTVAIVSTWYASDPGSALNYVKSSSDLSPETRQEILKTLPAQN